MKRKFQPLMLVLVVAVLMSFVMVSCSKDDDVKNPPPTDEPSPMPPRGR